MRQPCWRWRHDHGARAQSAAARAHSGGGELGRRRKLPPARYHTTRKGITVEIGNTDAEGRLVLADALALADEDKPELIADFATLTGAARVALGPDLPAFFTDDDVLAAELMRAWPRRGRSAVAAAAVAALRGDARIQSGRYQQCRPAARAAPSPRPCSCSGSWRPNPGCMSTCSPGRRPPKPGRPEGGELQAARALYACSRRATAEPAKMADFDPRVTPFRADLAA